MEVTAKRFPLTDGERSSVLQHLIRGGDLSRGARQRRDAGSRRRGQLRPCDRTRSLGGDLIELPRDAWKQLAN